MRLIYFTHSLKDTQKFAQRVKNLFLQKKIKNILLISGELGAGKTTFIRYLLRAFGVKKRISSPTFILWQTYQADKKFLNHLDLYRLDSVEPLLKMGLFEKMHKKDHLFLVEWGERMIKYLNKKHLPFSHLIIIRLGKRKRIFDLSL